MTTTSPTILERISALLDGASELLTTVAVLFAAIALVTQFAGCSAAQLRSVEDDFVQVGNATGECLWRCGLGCAAQGVGAAIANPPASPPLDPAKLKAARDKLCAEEPAHPACRGGE